MVFFLFVSFLVLGGCSREGGGGSGTSSVCVCVTCGVYTSSLSQPAMVFVSLCLSGFFIFVALLRGTWDWAGYWYPSLWGRMGRERETS
ncbi:hypothetical protein QBC39DRAFT_349279 [Podospora conica]|nr:hypothetical protein QBC39DRAFT_349279 [Schizothecium conicum]